MNIGLLYYAGALGITPAPAAITHLQYTCVCVSGCMSVTERHEEVLIHLDVAPGGQTSTVNFCSKFWWALLGLGGHNSRVKGCSSQQCAAASRSHIHPGYSCSDTSSWIRLSVLCWQDNLALQPTRFERGKERECVCVCACWVVLWWVCKLYPLICIGLAQILAKYFKLLLPHIDKLCPSVAAAALCKNLCPDLISAEL